MKSPASLRSLPPLKRGQTRAIQYMGRVERGEQNISIQNLIQVVFALNVEEGELIPKLSDLEKPRSDL